MLLTEVLWTAACVWFVGARVTLTLIVVRSCSCVLSVLSIVLSVLGLRVLDVTSVVLDDVLDDQVSVLDELFSLGRVATRNVDGLPVERVVSVNKAKREILLAVKNTR